MNEEIKQILEEIINRNGVVVHDHEYMSCQSCSENGLGPEDVEHKETCIVTRAKKLLA